MVSTTASGLSVIGGWGQLLRCPACAIPLRPRDSGLECETGAHQFEVKNGIPQLYWPTGEATADSLTQTVKSFYEETPFPNYDDLDSAGTLIQKARKSIFGRLLDEQVPLKARVLECGCGTGQLSNFLAVGNRSVFGTDICLNSLGLAQQFATQNNISSVHFVQQNLFRPVFPEASFDLVISNGVLHNTPDPPGGFRTISRLVRPGGHLLIGLYHRYGRLMTNIRRGVFRATGDRFTFLDSKLRTPGMSVAKKRAWFMDQYKHPLESQHLIGETLTWIREIGFEFIRSIPGTRLFHPFDPDKRLFEAEPAGNAVQRLLIELGLSFGGNREGGFFIVIARRPTSSAPRAPQPTPFRPA